MALPARAQHPLHQTVIEKTLVLWDHGASGEDCVDQESYAAMAASLGLLSQKYDVRKMDSAQLDDHTLLIVPSASSSRLTPTQVRRIVRSLGRGLKLVAGGEGPILPALHIKLGEPQHVRVVIDRHLPGNHLYWADQPAVRWVSERDSTSPGEVLYADSTTGHSLVVSGTFGKGKYIVLASYLDPLSGQGYSRFPTMANAIARDLGCKSAFRRPSVDAYFDPGYRVFTPSDSLAAVWKSWGIRAVHTSAWYYDDSNPYDYRKLIDAAHRNGILVYAWLEWPHVGRGFWQRHPEWREKNALLQDAKLDWLLPMDLQDSTCMRAALIELSRLLALDWDGVDIAEFTITGAGGQALAGPSRPDWFTSFGPAMRREFQAVGGFDPIELVDPNSRHFWERDSLGLEKFYAYRKAVNNRLLRQVVESILDKEKREKRDWELIHTIVDNSLHPEFDRLFGFDLDTTLQLVKKYGITLNVEDPYMEWEKPPVRYRYLRERLLKLLPARSSMIDINVVPIHPDSQLGFASSQQTGIELLQQLQRASEQHGRVCVYCESSVFDQDWPLVPHAMAFGSTARLNANGWTVTVPSTVSFDVNAADTVFSNGVPWPCYGPGGIVLPAGTHRLTTGTPSAKARSPRSGLRLIAISDELVDCKAVDGGFDITYASPARCLASVSARPKKFFIDGADAQLPILSAHHYFVLVLPSGKHRLRVAGD